MTQPLFSIIHPSRGRGELFLKTYQKWIDSSWMKSFEYILSLDSDDSSYYKLPVPIRLTQNDNKNVVDAMNAGAKVATGKILICIADDFDCPNKWDELILQHINPDKEEALRINDGIMKYECMSLPIMTKKLYDKLGYIYFPEYTGMFADTDLLEVCKRMGTLKTADILFPHNHWINGKAKFDETYKRHNNKESYVHGEKLFIKRKAENFGL